MNYAYQSYVLKNLLNGKHVWGYATSVIGKSIDKKALIYATLRYLWDVDNYNIITRIK